MDYVKDAMELAEAGYSVEKIARILHGDAHQMCIDLVVNDISIGIYRKDRGNIALFFDKVFTYQASMERWAYFCNHVAPLID